MRWSELQRWFGRERMLARIEPLVYRWRGPALAALLALSALLGLCAAVLRFDPALSRWLPLEHPWMAALLEHQDDFGGAETLWVSLEVTGEGDILQAAHLERLRELTAAVAALPGASRISSLATPDLRHVEVVDGAAVAGPLMPPDFRASEHALAQLRERVRRAELAGRHVAPNLRSALVQAQLAERDADGRRIDLRERARRIDALRERFEGAGMRVRIAGHAAVVAELDRALPRIWIACALSVGLIAVLLALALGQVRLALVPLAGALLAVAWQCGLAALAGVRFDAAGLLAPLVIFATALLLSLLLLDAWLDELAGGKNGFDASLAAFRRLALPASAALLGLLAGALLLLRVLPMAGLRDQALALAMGAIGALVATQLLLPLCLSMVGVGDAERLLRVQRGRRAVAATLLRGLSVVARPAPAAVVILAMAALTGWAAWQAESLRGAPATPEADVLSPQAQANRDALAVAAAYPHGPERLDVIAQGDAEACVDHDAMEQVDRIAWHLANVPGVRGVESLPGAARAMAVAFADGHPRFLALPRNRYNLVQAITPIPASSGLFNADCSAMVVRLQLENRDPALLAAIGAAVERFAVDNARGWHELHKGTESRYCTKKRAARRALGERTLALRQHVEGLQARGRAAAQTESDASAARLRGELDAAREALQSLDKACPVEFRMATGPLAPVAAAQDALAGQAGPALGAIAGAMFVALALALRGVAPALCALVPALVGAALSYAVLALLGVRMSAGLVLAVPLLAGAGAVFGMLLHGGLAAALDAGRSLEQALDGVVRGEARPLLFGAVVLAAALLPWWFAGLRAQAELGLLLGFGFLLQGACAVLLGPALARVLLDPE